MFYPRGTPRPIVNKLHAEIGKAVDTPDVKAFLPREALDAVASEDGWVLLAGRRTAR